jgi:hypothetical protein
MVAQTSGHRRSDSQRLVDSGESEPMHLAGLWRRISASEGAPYICSLRMYSSERPTQLRSMACRYPGLLLSHQRLLPAHQARLLAIEE